MRYTFRTWHGENAVVATVLLAVWLCTGSRAVELLGSAAVVCGFVCTSISDRMTEREAQRPTPSVHCYRVFWWFYLAKEIGFTGYFAWKGAWSALVGCGVFLSYPLWRKAWRRAHPLQKGP